MQEYFTRHLGDWLGMVPLLVDLLVDSAPLEAGCETRLLWLETKISDEKGQQICSCV